jgi:multidrug efflux pump subunit AcrA (membrane-fusion protein)
MTALPAPLLRGLSVLALGAAVTLGHITFAAAASKPVQVASATSLTRVADVDATGSITSGRELADNCYFEVVREKTASGKVLTRRVHECD